MKFRWLPANDSYLSGRNQYILAWKGNLIPGSVIRAASIIVLGSISGTPGSRRMIMDAYNDIGPLFLSKPVFFHPSANAVTGNIWAYYGSVEFDNLEIADNQNTVKFTLAAPDDIIAYVSSTNPTPFYLNGAVNGGNALLIGD